MNLILFFRLIIMSIFQAQICYNKKSFGNEKMSYSNQLFYIPRVFAKDGWNISLQIHHSNYCSSENGYREFGHTMQNVEWGFPSENEDLLKESAENPEEITGTVRSISISNLEEIFIKHGGIDWEKTISIEQFNKMTES